jgi:hypothetical protein
VNVGEHVGEHETSPQHALALVGVNVGEHVGEHETSPNPLDDDASTHLKLIRSPCEIH